MTRAEELAFYQEAREVRDLDDMTIDLIMKAEQIDINDATVEDCKKAIYRYQYVDMNNRWKWSTDHQAILERIKARNTAIPIF